MSDAEIEAFQDALDELGIRVSEFLAEGTDRTPEDIEKAVAGYERPDLLDDRPVDEDDS